VLKTVTPEAIRLLHEGALALSKVESAGLRIDMAYLRRTIDQVKIDIQGIEEGLKRDAIWGRWRRKFGRKAKIGSIEQLGQLLFVDMGYPVRALTATGKPKMDEAALETVDLEFAGQYLRWKKLNKALSTYLYGIQREVCDGVLHPSFNLHLMLTYRSSSSDPNFQNIPIRNKEIGKLIRQCFIARDGNRLLEIDFGMVEVLVAQCYHHDPTMLKYILDPTSDMHWDTAFKLFRLPKSEADQQGHHKKGVRDAAKNMFVFPQFYGSYYADCARAIWKAMDRRKFTMSDGTLVKDHLARLGVTKRGACDGGRPERGTFERLVKDVEDWMWNEQYTTYTRWKNNWWNAYLKCGYVPMHTGFVCTGIYRRNQVINFPVQGSAFHCLLWSIIELVKWLEQYKFQARVVGQIHDCLLVDCPENEIQDVLTAAHRIMTVELPKAWPWIVVPMKTETDVTPSGGNWHQKELWVSDGGVWGPKVKAA
jgi:DNA polymerase I-like protein with 3'-5' exonuclease and polymerase domains